jgi:hypothetical protein
VALHGELAFLGAPAGQLVGSNRYVHVYRRVAGEWTLEQTLLPPDGNTRFGDALDFDGTTLVVGAPPLPSGALGRAWVYTHDGAAWVGTELSYPPTSTTPMNFGGSVAVDGEFIMVGAPLADVFPGGSEVGAAFGYRYHPVQGWVIKQQLQPSSPSGGLAFGIDVAVSGNDALVGTAKDRVHAFEFHQGTLWTETQVLSPSLASPASAFGQTISMSGERAVIGAWQDDTDPDKGSAFVFESVCGEWSERQRLAAPANALTYGRAVALDGDVVVVTAHSEVVGGQNMAGAAYAYRWDGATWDLEQRLHAATPTVNEQFGRAVALHGDRVLLGAITASAAGGSGYVFDALPVPRPWVELGFALAGSGTPSLRGTGTLAPATPLELTVACGLAATSGVLFVGFSELYAPFKGGVVVPDPVFSPGLTLDANGRRVLPLNWPAGVPAGTEVVLQAWFLDASGPLGLSATNGLRATAMP